MEGQYDEDEPGRGDAVPRPASPGADAAAAAALASQEAMMRRYGGEGAAAEEGSEAFQMQRDAEMARQLAAGQRKSVPAAGGGLSEEEMVQLAMVDDPQARADIEAQMRQQKDAELAAEMQSAAAAGHLGGGEVNSLDAQMAYEMQQREVEDARVPWNRRGRGGDDGGFHEVEVTDVEGDLALELDGRVTLLKDLPWWRRVLALTCPCVLGNPCSRNRRGVALRSWFASAVGLLSVVQVVWTALSLADGGFDSDNAGFGPGPAARRTWGGTTRTMYTDREVWRMFTPAFFCSGLAHLALTVWAQIRMAVVWERDLGAFNVLVVTVVGGMNASVLSSIVQERTVSTAGHATFFAMGGAKLGHMWMAWEHIGERERRINLGTTAFWMAVLGGFLFVPGIGTDNAASVGAMLVGLFHSLAIYVDELPEDARWRRRLYPVIGRLLMIGMAVIEVLLLIDLDRLKTEEGTL